MRTRSICPAAVRSAGFRVPTPRFIPGPKPIIFAFAILAAAGTCPVPPAAASPGDAGAVAPTGLERLGLWFEAHPEYKSTPGSGWKPYNRDLWFYQTRPVPEGAFGGQLRLDAFHQAMSLRQSPEFERRGGGGWFNIGPTEYSGRCVSIDFGPPSSGVVYVGSAGGGLWKSADDGETWGTTTDFLPTLAVGAVCVLPWNPDIVLIGTGEGTGVGNVTAGKGIFGIGLLKSVDAGATWNATSLSYGRAATHGFNVIEDNPITHTILAGANDGLWRSTDEGDTWTRVLANGNFFDVKWKPGDAARVYVAKGRDPFLNSQSNNGIYVSADDGLTFTLAGVGQPPGSTIGKTKIAVTPDNPNVIYAHYVSANTSRSIGIYRSYNDGITWTVRNNSTNMTGGQGWYNLVLAVDPDNVNRVITGGVNLYTSDDGGQTYVNLNPSAPFGHETAPHYDNHALVYVPSTEASPNNTVWIATDGGPWRSFDDGATWSPRRAGIITYQFYDICVAQSDDIFTMGGTQDNGIPGRAGEDAWFQSTLTADGMVCNIDPADAQTVYAEWQFGRQVKTTDGGQSWLSIQNGITGDGAWVTPLAQDANNGNHLYTASSTGTYRTTNGGGVWQNVHSHNPRWISMSPIDGDVVWTVANGSVRRTTDDGATWALMSSFPGNGLETKIHADPVDVSTAFVTFGGYSTGGPHAVMTTDGGATWVDITGDFPDQPANAFTVDPSRPDEWYLGSDIGVWKTTDGGATWLPFGSGMVNVVITDLELRRSARKLVAGTYGRGVWEIDLPLDPASVEAADPARRTLMLDPPYPQPVSEQTSLRFAARTDQPISLSIVDAQGRRVDSVLGSGAGPDPGGDLGNGVIRTVRWSAAGFANGVYFAVLRAGDQTLSRKLVVRR